MIFVVAFILALVIIPALAGGRGNAEAWTPEPGEPCECGKGFVPPF